MIWLTIYHNAPILKQWTFSFIFTAFQSLWSFQGLLDCQSALKVGSFSLYILPHLVQGVSSITGRFWQQRGNSVSLSDTNYLFIKTIILTSRASLRKVFTQLYEVLGSAWSLESTIWPSQALSSVLMYNFEYPNFALSIIFSKHITFILENLKDHTLDCTVSPWTSSLTATFARHLMVVMVSFCRDRRWFSSSGLMVGLWVHVWGFEEWFIISNVCFIICAEASSRNLAVQPQKHKFCSWTFLLVLLNIFSLRSSAFVISYFEMFCLVGCFCYSS